jgi:hypothetical protein
MLWVRHQPGPHTDADGEDDERRPCDQVDRGRVGDPLGPPAVGDDAEVDPAQHREEVHGGQHGAGRGKPGESDEQRSEQAGRR